MSDPEPTMFEVEPGDPKIERLVALLRAYGWLTRAQIHDLLKWEPRLIRAVARAGCQQIVRGQKGFALVETATADELSHAARQSIAQGTDMQTVGLIWLKLAHAKVG